MRKNIFIKGARQHNLKNITLEIPRNQLIVFTGVSGSGKSTLVFNTIHSEGRRHLMESLSAYERMGLKKNSEANVDLIEGLSPTIAIEQKNVSRNPRSTVGTFTDLYAYTRLLFSRVSRALCPICKKELPVMTKKRILEYVGKCSEITSLVISVPLSTNTYAQNSQIFLDIQKRGFKEVVWKGKKYCIDQFKDLDEVSNTTILSELEIYIGRITGTSDKDGEIKSLVEKALEAGDGVIKVHLDNDEIPPFYSEFACLSCKVVVSEVSASGFSFNTPHGACSICTGLGIQYYVDPEQVIPDKTKSLSEGAINLIGWKCEQEKFHKNRKILEGLAKAYNFKLNTPIKDLPAHALDIILYGTKGKKISIENPSIGGKPLFEKFPGLINMVYERFNSYAKDEANTLKGEDKGLIRERICPNCLGARLKKNRLLYCFEKMDINKFSNIPIYELKGFCERKLNSDTFCSNNPVAVPILRDMLVRLNLLSEIGLDYLTLERPTTTLSGGESQRIRLINQLSSGLMGMIYILDEPSTGLHSKDSEKIVSVLLQLRDIGNSILVVEHDDEIISRADYIVDIGPGAGVLGGEIVAQGTLEQIKQNELSLTGQYLSEKKSISVPKKRRNAAEVKEGSFGYSPIEVERKYLEVLGARENNLNNLNVRFPLGCFIAITGVSGSGKSTLIGKVLYEKLRSHHEKRNANLIHDVEIKGAEWIDKVFYIDQLPIGRTSRSNPATYVGIFDFIRKKFAKTEKAKELKFKAAHFSFNTPEGRCNLCSGLGIIVTEMHFMSDIERECESCRGQRFNEQILNIKYSGKNIAEILDMSIEEAAEFFSDDSKINDKLVLMSKLGLGYMKLGQSSATLSGGEAQRIKLVEEISNSNNGSSNLYILDEPTTGLHLDDVQRLHDIIQHLVEVGNTVIIIEHNLHLIKTVDYVIDLGPGGGTKGGNIVASGTPEEVAEVNSSYTGQFLGNLLNHTKR
ncbi:excinuclease ABC subunit UvrA [Bacillus cereus]|uniref:excinuclease ABC subunit UvrA n=1 Tax=Bacillus cereus TaxID=1396 RepID=UPI001247DB95|nr:excinuclease ABC subunit UvrA [Bacillus cereus]MCU5475464.1 excinuclease ABC subunit UvrA [Bacillus cereus]MCU5614899.1 excinuclease ABC subunit UvrA [Bacillus cereus]